MVRQKIIAVDCETDPFVEGRVPKPFIWGAYDGKTFQTWRETKDFIAWAKDQNALLYAHNGGKFDFMLIFKHVTKTRARIINGRFVELTLGKATLRDSYSIVPVPLSAIQKDDIDYRIMEEDLREEYMESDIIPYLKTDCVVLWDTVTKYIKEAGKAATIATNALNFSKKLGVNPGRTTHKFDEQFRPYYFGGRTECFRPGTHHNVHVLDIVSSYPHAMRHDHPCGTNVEALESLEGLSTEDIQRSFITLRCRSRKAFCRRAENGSLEFPDDYGKFNVTGWEYLTAKRRRLITNENILSVNVFADKINFSDYVDYWFDYKQRHDKKTQPIEYTIGKIMMNSLYGKLAQNPTRYYDYELKDIADDVDEENGWELYGIFDDVAIHRRSVMWKFQYDYGKGWEHKPLFNNVAAGASVTGFARAYLLDAIASIGFDHVIYCDTDSVMCTGQRWRKLPLGEKLGQWAHEGLATIGHFAGKKLYGLQMQDGTEKIACKGSKLDFEQIKRVTAGEIVTWSNPAPTFSLARGTNFVQREIRATSGA